ncbi:MAG TPA: dihydroorotase, partial [Chitinophagaceae bacterium]|nr:dihydroorotase [Chitinophagaceae bacterium]
MNLLLQQLTLVTATDVATSTVDIRIQNGIITAINTTLPPDHATEQVVNMHGAFASSGFIDLFAHGCEPGYEHRETLESIARSAASGGFTQVAIIPNTNPVVDNKSLVNFIAQQPQLAAQLLPLGALTKGCDGKELAEMYDMHQAGAVAFTDGLKPIQTSGLMLKALQYVKAFNGTVVQMPIDQSIGKYGLMHEGVISTRMGLPGIPTLAEVLLIKRDIDLLRYTESKLHITGVTSAEGIDIIAAAKKEGLAVTCSVTPWHLMYCDEDLANYDTNLKLHTPLRSKADRDALRLAVNEGVVDAIASHHMPQDWDAKHCEFEYAKAGMIGLQSAYALVHTILPELTPQQIVQLFSSNPANILALQEPSIAVGNKVSLTFFQPQQSFTVRESDNTSKSTNSCIFNLPLNAKIVGTCH